MKTIDLATTAQPIDILFKLAEDDDVLIRLPGGKVFLLTAVVDTDASGDDFSDEVARTRRNAALMALLDERSADTSRVSIQDARKRLGIE